jgi:lipopolysaccharide biosynthesis glycosyltransferase
MTELHMACAADSAYAAHSAAMLHSALIHGGRPVVVHYLNGPRFPPDDISKLSQMFRTSAGRIEFHEIADDQLRGLPVEHRFGSAMWYRLFLPDLLPELTRVLYLDIDTLVMDRLDPLWDVDLDGRYLAAVRNVFMEYHRHRPKELGIEINDYFNSGVLLFNLALMRERNFAGAVVQLVREREPELAWPDQDALNLAAASRWLALPPRWNVMNSFITRPQLAADAFGKGAVAKAIASPAIRHFEGPGVNKPWHARHDRRERDLYRRHRLETPWPEVRLDGDTPANRVRRMAAEVRDRGRALRSRPDGKS